MSQFVNIKITYFGLFGNLKMTFFAKNYNIFCRALVITKVVFFVYVYLSVIANLASDHRLCSYYHYYIYRRSIALDKLNYR